MKYFCCDPRRLEVIKHAGNANGIEYLEVRDHLEPDVALRQRTLFVRLLRSVPVKPNGDCALELPNVLIDGGERLATIAAEWVAAADKLPPGTDAALIEGIGATDRPRTLVVRTAVSGDFSQYTFHLRASSGTDQPPDGFDARLSEIDFSFKVECPSDFDCATPSPCPPRVSAKPHIDYLAKDYNGFRRLMLDRLNLLVPGWSERSAADVGVALIELLAYASDNLSYRQDAIATEAYLATARQRVSVRRHARLVDYLLHEGCNARAFVHFNVNGQKLSLAQRSQLLTRTPPLPTLVPPNSQALKDAIAAGALVYETAHDAVLDERLNELSFYTWGDRGCCLPSGSTRATLRGHVAQLKAGDLLLLEEVRSPSTYLEEDADRAHRWVVRLTGVTLSVDPSGQLFNPVPVNGPLDVTEIAWDAADALPFPLCLSVTDWPELTISVARGNIVLADHGRSVLAEDLGQVAPVRLTLTTASQSATCRKPDAIEVPPRFRPALAQGPLTHGFDLARLLSVPISEDEAWWPASSLTGIAPREATPLIMALTGKLGTQIEPWAARRDLLSSANDAMDFVVEVEDDGRAHLRFGDDGNGKRPDSDTRFTASYRVGNGVSGNVGAEAIAHVVGMAAGSFNTIRNPLPAAGGVDAENIEVARRDAPQAFRTQERAVTPADYAAVAARRPEVQRAAATFRWTGSWHTVFVTADRFGGGEVDARFSARLRRYLERFRMAGYDLEVNGPQYVPLDVDLHICVKPDYFRAQVLQAVQRELSSSVLPDARLGVFHPDNFSFGEPVYLSRVIAAAQAVDGVEAVRPLRFHRLATPGATSLDEGVIAIGSLEVAQLANNPNFRERGRLTLTAGGGK